MIRDTFSMYSNFFNILEEFNAISMYFFTLSRAAIFSILLDNWWKKRGIRWSFGFDIDLSLSKSFNQNRKSTFWIARRPKSYWFYGNIPFSLVELIYEKCIVKIKDFCFAIYRCTLHKNTHLYNRIHLKFKLQFRHSFFIFIHNQFLFNRIGQLERSLCTIQKRRLRFRQMA